VQSGVHSLALAEARHDSGALVRAADYLLGFFGIVDGRRHVSRRTVEDLVHLLGRKKTLLLGRFDRRTDFGAQSGGDEDAGR